MMWAVTEFLISEHEADFALRLLKEYQTLPVLIKVERFRVDMADKQKWWN